MQETRFRANGSTLSFAGFLAVYRESFDDVARRTMTSDRMLPPLEVGDRVRLLAIDTAQHFTEPPPRYSEASLVKALEEHGIGRPSTYASIIQTLLYKKYCELINRRFVPTDLGKIVNRFLTGNFERYVDYGFTAAMEDELDNISRGEEEWVPVLERFWVELKKQIDDVTENVTRSGRSDGARHRHRSGLRPPGQRSLRPLRRVCADRHARGRRKSRSSRACARTSAWTT